VVVVVVVVVVVDGTVGVELGGTAVEARVEVVVGALFDAADGGLGVELQAARTVDPRTARAPTTSCSRMRRPWVTASSKEFPRGVRALPC
jgi:hypothetical protein